MNEAADRPFLETRGLEKRFPGNLALDSVDFSATSGEVHAIVGANGAGKSTLMNILSGATRPNAGEIFLNGSPEVFHSPADALSAGISCVYQELSLVPQLDVARNVYLGREPKSRSGSVDISRLYSQTEELLRKYNLQIRADARIESLSVAQQQMVELARALSFDSRVLILDEPTSVLSLAEKDNLFGIIRRLRDAGLLVIYVSHFLGEVIEIADRITVIRDGKIVAMRDSAAVDVDTLAADITGEPKTDETVEERPDRNQYARKSTIRLERESGSTTIELREGEIVGIAGLVGSGRSKFAKTLAGASDTGDRVIIDHPDETITYHNVQKAIAHGVVYLTEDRKLEGLYSSLDVIDNTASSGLNLLSAGIFRRPRQESQTARNMLERLRIVTTRFDMPVTKLSGGNQQKVLIARALMTKPKLLICDEPTRGVDIAAKGQIHRILRELAEQGVMILVVSSENEELLSLTDRILIMQAGAVTGEVATLEIDETQLLIAISGDQNKEVLN